MDFSPAPTVREITFKGFTFETSKDEELKNHTHGLMTVLQDTNRVFESLNEAMEEALTEEQETPAVEPGKQKRLIFLNQLLLETATQKEGGDVVALTAKVNEHICGIVDVLYQTMDLPSCIPIIVWKNTRVEAFPRSFVEPSNFNVASTVSFCEKLSLKHGTCYASILQMLTDDGVLIKGRKGGYQMRGADTTPLGLAYCSVDTPNPLWWQSHVPRFGAAVMTFDLATASKSFMQIGTKVHQKQFSQQLLCVDGNEPNWRLVQKDQNKAFTLKPIDKSAFRWQVGVGKGCTSLGKDRQDTNYWTHPEVLFPSQLNVPYDSGKTKITFVNNHKCIESRGTCKVCDIVYPQSVEPDPWDDDGDWYDKEKKVYSKEIYLEFGYKSLPVSCLTNRSSTAETSVDLMALALLTGCGRDEGIEQNEKWKRIQRIQKEFKTFQTSNLTIPPGDDSDVDAFIRIMEDRFAKFKTVLVRSGKRPLEDTGDTSGDSTKRLALDEGKNEKDECTTSEEVEGNIGHNGDGERPLDGEDSSRGITQKLAVEEGAGGED